MVESQTLQKMVYFQHRSFLPKVRKIHNNFPSTSVPNEPPAAKSMSFIGDHIEKLENCLTSEEEKDIKRSSGCTGDYALHPLPLHDRYLNTPVEPMHPLKKYQND